ncbi:hypothetical protein LWI28_000313 [Acer negundo]|uniref:FAR1 domain-containing protein n=1 Tax=Acer negundo TaxID=4023 RepID=A0AAD5IT77_ACENE|nr:hypothetical protein LWI28_000313 [Acer negundo]
MEAADDIDSKIRENNMVGRDICMPEGGEMIDFYDGRELIVSEINGSVEPYVGMEFDSEEAAMVYYDLYAKRVGFIIRVGNCHRSNRGGPIVSRRFLCNKEGFRVNNRKTKSLEVRKPREVTREGCKAMIMVRKEKSGKWVVAKVETEHSHPLGIPSGKGRRDTVQARPQDEKDKKIRELSLELNRANQQLEKCRGQLDMVLKDIERHTDHLTNSIQNIIKNICYGERRSHRYVSEVVVATTIGATAVRGAAVDGIRRRVEILWWSSMAQAMRGGGVGEEIEFGIK